MPTHDVIVLGAGAAGLFCAGLAGQGWLYAGPDAADYDRARALFPADLLEWVQETEPKAWEAITKNHGVNAADTLLNRVRDQLETRGTLDVLRHGVELLGLKKKLMLAQLVQAGPGGEPRHLGPVCGQPVAGGASGAVQPAQ